VAKSPVWSWTAAFSSVGTFWFTKDMKYYKLEKAAEFVGYADQNDPGLAGESEFKTLKSPLGSGADMVVVSADVENTGKPAEYIMTLTNNGQLRVTRAFDPVKSWLLQSKPELPDWTHGRSYGAAWSYQNRVFFAQNKAGGMLEVLHNSIDLVAGTVLIEKIGPSFDIGATDGANCINKDIPTKYSKYCGPKVGAYSAITKSDPFPPPGATNVRPNQELIFLPDHDSSVTGYQVFLGPATLGTDGSVDSVEWHLACNLLCGVNVCKPPYGLDNTLGGNFAWRVDQLKADGTTKQGEVWQFSLVKTFSYNTRAVADTYIDKRKTQPEEEGRKYGDKRHMLMRSKKQKNPQFGFVKFQVPPPSYAGVPTDCTVSVVKAEMRLVVLSVPMKDVMVYRVTKDVKFTEDDTSEVTSATGKHPGSGEYPNVFDGDELVAHGYGPVAPKKNFTVDVTTALADVFKAGGETISFGLETTSAVSRFCAQSYSKPRGGLNEKNWCYPRLEVHLGLGECPVKEEQPSCNLPANSPPGPLDAMCGDTAPTFSGTPTNWREKSVITTTTTTTTTTLQSANPIKEGQCRYNDHVYCPWPNTDTKCSGDQCCPDQSTCPSSQFHQAQGCNLKKYDCTADLPANLTCREADEVFCPGTDTKCSGDTCCPNNTTCPSASVQQASQCGPKSVDCQAPLSAEFTCAIGEFVFCPASDADMASLSSTPKKECSAHSKCAGLSLDGACCPTAEGVFLDCCDGAYTYQSAKCTGNQCCPDGSTCPSAPAAEAEGCGPKKATCGLLSWTLKLRVTSILCSKVSEDTNELVEALTGEFIAAKMGTDSTKINVTSCAGGEGSQRRLAEEGMVVTAKVDAPGGWSQKKFDSSVESGLLSDDASTEMEEMLSEVDGLQEASSGDMEFKKIEAEREEPEEASSTPSPSDSATQAPSTSLRASGGSDADSDPVAKEASSASTFCFLPALALVLVSTCDM